MSTRATYAFSTPEITITFYIYYDGYPEGAAEYFLNALLLTKTKWMGLPEAFIRANSFAEFTSSHDAHGDTEFRYDVLTPSFNDPPVIKVSRRNLVTGKWGVVWSGELIDFIAAFLSSEAAERLL